MNEDQKKWLLDLQSKGVRFEYCNINDEWVNDGKCTFSASQEKYRIQAQPIPDIPDWRELCREMQDKGIEFEAICGDGSWKKSRPYFFPDYMLKTDYRIPNQPIPEWRDELNFEIEDTEYPKWSNEKMIEETKPDPREEIPHRELQIQWHEDCIHALRTGEPMREWQFRRVLSDGAVSEWHRIDWPEWRRMDAEYRRKPRTVKYWHCVGGYEDSGGKKDTVWFASGDRHDVFSETERYKARYPLAKFSPITETTVEIE